MDGKTRLKLPSSTRDILKLFSLSRTNQILRGRSPIFEGCRTLFNKIFNPSPKLYTPSTLNIQMKLILLWVWAEQAVLGRAKTALKFKYEI